MTMLDRIGEYNNEKTKKALDLLLVDRRNEFQLLAESILGSDPSIKKNIDDWEQFILCFCMDVSKSFASWSGKTPLESTSDIKALTILRQLSRGKSSMNQMASMLNIAYDLAEEFKTVYGRI